MPLIKITLPNGQVKHVNVADSATPQDIDEITNTLAAEASQGPSYQELQARVDAMGPASEGRYRPPGFKMPSNPPGVSPFVAFKPVVEPGIRLWEGVNQLANRIENKIGLNDDKHMEAYDTSVDKRRAEYEAMAGEGSGTAADIMSGLIPIGSNAARISGKGLSWIWSATKAAVKGGAIATTQYADKDTSKWEQAAWGAAFPMAFQAIGSIPAKIRNYVSSAISRADTARTAATRKAAEQFYGGSQAVPEPTPFTPAQASGNPVLTRLENRARGAKMQELNAQQLDETFKRFDELADLAEKKSGMPAKSADIVQGTNKTVDVLDAQMRKAKNEAWDLGMSKVLALSKVKNTRVPLSNLESEYKRILNEDANPFNFTGSVLPEGVKDAFKAMQEAAAKGMKINPTIPAIQRIMKGLGQDTPRGEAILSAADRRLEMYRRRLFGALNSDLDAAGAVADPAFEQLQKTRQAYAVASERLERLENDSINRLFGNKEAFANPGETLKRFYKLDPDDQQYALDILSKRSPEIIQSMQAHRLRQALDVALKDGAATESRFDMDVFQKELFGGRDGLKGSKLWSGELKGRMLEGAARLKILMNNLPRGSAGGSVVWPEEVAINIVSRSPEFVARAVTRMAYGKYGDELFGTKQGIEALRTLSDVNMRKTQAGAQALAWVLNYVNQDEGDGQ